MLSGRGEHIQSRLCHVLKNVLSGKLRFAGGSLKFYVQNCFCKILICDGSFSFYFKIYLYVIEILTTIHLILMNFTLSLSIKDVIKPI